MKSFQYIKEILGGKIKTLPTQNLIWVSVDESYNFIISKLKKKDFSTLFYMCLWKYTQNVNAEK